MRPSIAQAAQAQGLTFVCCMPCTGPASVPSPVAAERPAEFASDESFITSLATDMSLVDSLLVEQQIAWAIVACDKGKLLMAGNEQRQMLWYSIGQ